MAVRSALATISSEGGSAGFMVLSHALSFFGRLDPVGETDEVLADLKWAEQGKAEANPAGGEHAQVGALAVEEMKKAMVGLAPEV